MRFLAQPGNVSATPQTAVESAGDDISVPKFALGEGNNHEWATGEHEVAEIGPSATEDIVGLLHFKDLYTLDGPVYFLVAFRKSESQPFARLVDIPSGMPQ